MSFEIRYILGRDKWGMTIEPTPIKGIGLPSIVMTWLEDEGDTNAKDKESRDIWC
jgi:hypothetical protein